MYFYFFIYHPKTSINDVKETSYKDLEHVTPNTEAQSQLPSATGTIKHEKIGISQSSNMETAECPTNKYSQLRDRESWKGI